MLGQNFGAETLEQQLEIAKTFDAMNEVRQPAFAPKTMLSSGGYMISPNDIHDLAQLFFPAGKDLDAEIDMKEEFNVNKNELRERLQQKA